MAERKKEQIGGTARFREKQQKKRVGGWKGKPRRERGSYGLGLREVFG